MAMKKQSVRKTKMAPRVLTPRLVNHNEAIKEFLSSEEIDDINAEVDAEIREMDLTEIRKLAGITQVDAAKRAALSQPEISRIENGTRHEVATLRRYIEALGGDLIVLARFGDHSIRLRSLS